MGSGNLRVSINRCGRPPRDSRVRGSRMTANSSRTALFTSSCSSRLRQMACTARSHSSASDGIAVGLRTAPAVVRIASGTELAVGVMMPERLQKPSLVPRPIDAMPWQLPFGPARRFSANEARVPHVASSVEF